MLMACTSNGKWKMDCRLLTKTKKKSSSRISYFVPTRTRYRDTETANEQTTDALFFTSSAARWGGRFRLFHFFSRLHERTMYNIGWGSAFRTETIYSKEERRPVFLTEGSPKGDPERFFGHSKRDPRCLLYGRVSEY